MFKKKIFIYRKSLAFKKVKDINQNQITKNQRLNFKFKKIILKILRMKTLVVILCVLAALGK